MFNQVNMDMLKVGIQQKKSFIGGETVWEWTLDCCELREEWANCQSLELIRGHTN